ncbi:MAG: hypothetical protein E5Y10_04755 [Mesorhizobium sp.]|nr:MAG: hypothetical protein E5Y19_15960 [Mesorhizobium sp.]TIN42953.1 MAG: hypothetical protein E5Y13_04095 [Mesorhizobium sp.]TJU83095.1 MAG: hypothetical protein E5Y15_15590 [Mesorhizobium sp.]TJU91881.1 MAG: hypothetical protein E5Y10_04755 [Mesorhizobium sp.]
MIKAWFECAPQLVDVAMGRTPADMVIRNGRRQAYESPRGRNPRATGGGLTTASSSRASASSHRAPIPRSWFVCRPQMRRLSSGSAIPLLANQEVTSLLQR